MYHDYNSDSDDDGYHGSHHKPCHGGQRHHCDQHGHDGYPQGGYKGRSHSPDHHHMGHQTHAGYTSETDSYYGGGQKPCSHGGYGGCQDGYGSGHNYDCGGSPHYGPGHGSPGHGSPGHGSPGYSSPGYDNYHRADGYGCASGGSYDGSYGCGHHHSYQQTGGRHGCPSDSDEEDYVYTAQITPTSPVAKPLADSSQSSARNDDDRRKSFCSLL